MKIFVDTKEIANKEKYYTAKLLKNLVIIEKQKLYSDLKYSSLHNYIIKELKYSDAEATVRVNAVRLMMKSDLASEKIERGELTLTNACLANRALSTTKDKGKIQRLVKVAVGNSTRELKNYISKENNQPRSENLRLDEGMIREFDLMRKRYGDLSTYELIKILLEKELRAPGVLRRERSCAVKNSRFIPKSVKSAVYTGKCRKCGVRHSLEYDHKVKYSAGGTNSKQNIQILCRNCNKRKEVLAGQLNFFA